MSKKDLAVELNDLWNELEKEMGEGAALSVACEMLGVDPANAYEILAEHPEAIEVKP